ncbi:MAG: Na+:solute symporter, partial [Deltaproteobacteria bacterium]|nr:Na+:solute symporter [Deltaproteobacteria bacterium]
MGAIDWIVVAAFLAAMMVVGMLFSRKAGGSMTDFFISGRSLPWWLAGTSILATSFACDTPIHVTKQIRELGLSGAWFYWTGILFGPMMAFLFARLWRRAAIVTDVEFLELRYAGRPATALRIIMALFRTFGMTALTLGWVILGMVKIVAVLLELPPTVEIPLLGWQLSSQALVVALLVVIALVYTAASGLWGVVTTDLIEFVIALGGAIFLAVVALDAVGGIDGLADGLARLPAYGPETTDFYPRSFDSGGMSLGTFLIYALVLGWASAEVDGSGNKAQRFLACKDERHSLASGIWSLAVQNIIRSWPWYLAALCSIVLYPTLADNETAYPRMIAELLPVGVKGLLVAAFLAAFLSTVDTHLNLGASYLVNDLYRRFIYREGSSRHYVRAARLGIVFMALVSSLVAVSLGSVLGGLKLKGELMAGLGLVCIFRWYWWRVNAWSEISAMLASVATFAVLHTTNVGVEPVGALLGIEPGGDLFPARLLIIILVSTAAWLATTFLTRPVPREHLIRFFRLVRPAGKLWAPV